MIKTTKKFVTIKLLIKCTKKIVSDVAVYTVGV